VYAYYIYFVYFCSFGIPHHRTITRTQLPSNV
jgi:hypothetical protein